MDYSVRTKNPEVTIIDIFMLTMYQMIVKLYKEVTGSDGPSDNNHINLLELHCLALQLQLYHSVVLGCSSVQQIVKSPQCT